MFLVGWSDGSQGPLLPLLQEYYKIDYVIVSLIWIAITIGVIIAAVSNIYLADWIGFGLVCQSAVVISSQLTDSSLHSEHSFNLLDTFSCAGVSCSRRDRRVALDLA